MELERNTYLLSFNISFFLTGHNRLKTSLEAPSMNILASFHMVHDCTHVEHVNEKPCLMPSNCCPIE